MRLIDATALHKKLSFMQEQYRAERSNVKARMCKKIIAIIGLMPEIEAEPVMHGKWINAYDTHGGSYYKCSRCACYIEKIFFANDYEVNYCPNCGAKMEVKEND